MGMLEEAIREHLELRRLHGADPSQLAREEQAALGPLTDGSLDDSGVETWLGPDVAVALDDLHAEDGGRVVAQQEALYASQETAELDMSAILGIDLDGAPSEQVDRRSRGDTAAPAVRSGIGRGAPNLETELDRLDWEVSRKHTAAGRTHRGDNLEL